ncbi:hypothetical protein [Streptomyces chumphonensis]|uniref:hypothetical protein n=1 Tax=Streptomyces chumphonensis TaxID=1214925 RepID=UPI003D759CEA
MGDLRDRTGVAALALGLLLWSGASSASALNPLDSCAFAGGDRSVRDLMERARAGESIESLCRSVRPPAPPAEPPPPPPVPEPPPAPPPPPPPPPPPAAPEPPPAPPPAPAPAPAPAPEAITTPPAAPEPEQQLVAPPYASAARELPEPSLSTTSRMLLIVAPAVLAAAALRPRSGTPAPRSE